MDAKVNAPLEMREVPASLPTHEGLSFREVAVVARRFVRRQFPVIALCLVCSLLLGLTYLLSTPSRFTASAKLLIDPNKAGILKQQPGILDAQGDATQVDTHVELLKSDKLAYKVVNDLSLTEDQEFTAPTQNLLLAALYQQFPFLQPKSNLPLSRVAVGVLLKNRDVTRVGRTLVLEVSVTSLSAARAAQLANALAEAYIDDQLEAKYEATRRASAWLQERIRELRQQVIDADRRILEYKEKNKIVDVGNGGGARGLNDQQLTDLNSQLSLARAAEAETKARLDRIVEVMKREVPDQDIGDSLRSEVVVKLRTSYLELAKKEAIWAEKYGPNHLAPVNLRNEMREIRRTINQELSRLAQSAKNEQEIAKARIESLERSLREGVAEAQAVNRDRLGLRDLESNAQVYHSIYDNFLQRHMEAIQQQTFPVTEARVVNSAEQPLQRSSPATPIIMGSAAAFGLALGIGLALWREAFDRGLRTPQRVKEELGTPCIAVVPKLGRLVRSRSAKSKPTPQSKPISQASKSGPVFGDKGKILGERGDKMLRAAIAEPLSPFAEAFRSIKVVADLQADKVIGVTSTLTHEGKSTIASNFAQILTHGGKKVILLDADLRNPTLSRELSIDARTGLTDVLTGSLKLEEAVLRDEITNLMFLPSLSAIRITQTSEYLSSHEFRDLLRDLRSKFDYVVVDFPPLAPVVDARAAAHAIDSLIYVVEWGKTEVELINRHLSNSPEIRDKMLGVVLNKADQRMLEKQQGYKYSQYSKYYFYNDRSSRA
jgi:succinoglycan biosynthesis transport protein ExoP